MTENGTTRIADTDLHAYVDGELDGEALVDVEHWLAAHPEDAAKVHRYRLQKLHLHELYDDALTAPLPPGVEAALAGRRAPAWLTDWRRIAAGLIIFVLGGAAGWGGFSMSGDGFGFGPVPAAEANFGQRALYAHVVYAHDDARPVETGFSNEADMVHWLSIRLGHSLRRPDLAGAGFRLIGGRLVNDEGTPAALFMYEDARGRRVTLYCRTGNVAGGTAFRFIAEHDMVAFYWTDGPLSYALTGEMPRGDLLHLAQMVYEDLEAK